MTLKSIVLHSVVVINICAFLTFLSYKVFLDGWDIAACVTTILSSIIIVIIVLIRKFKCEKKKPIKVFLDFIQAIGSLFVLLCAVMTILFVKNHVENIELDKFVSLTVKILALESSAYLSWISHETKNLRREEDLVYKMVPIKVQTS